jgi:3-oxoacyl-[acyl-carrier protein] reductase
MIPDTVSAETRSKLLDPQIIVPPLLCLVSPEADGVTGKRIVATQWIEAEPLAGEAG